MSRSAPRGPSSDSSLEGAASALRVRQAHVDPALGGFAREQRLAYAARIASRAADGRRIVIAFVDVPDVRLDAYRDELYGRLRLEDEEGALDMPAPRPYTETLAELVYDTGLVIHNTTPGAAPRGGGRERNLATFPGRFADEGNGADESWLTRLAVPLAGVAVLASILVAAGAFVVGRTTRPPD